MQLIKPSIEYKKSFLEAESEFQAKNEVRHVDPKISNIKETEKNFEKFLEKFSKAEKGIDIKKGYVPSTVFWLVDNGEFIGSVSIRHKLNENLLNVGGHIGYSIRPSARSKGYGTKILELALKETKNLGIQKVLVTCDDDNVGSLKIIEKNGGVLENKIKDEEKLKRRYWIENKQNDK